MAPRRVKLARGPSPSRRAPVLSDSEDDVSEPVKPSRRLRIPGFFFLLFLFLSSLAGHYFPVLWPGSNFTALPQPSPYPREFLPKFGRTTEEARSLREGDLHLASSLPSEISFPSSQHEEAGPLLGSSEQEQVKLLQTESASHQQPNHLESVTSSFSSDLATRGDDWQSVFVRDVKSQMWKEPLCKGIIPPKYHPPQRGLPIKTVEDLTRPNQRVLVVFARHGLGNSLRSFVSAFVYATLSGRRLVRMHAAEHAKVYDLLCESFKCGFDAIRWSNRTGLRPMDIYRQFDKLKPFYFLEEYKKNSDIAGSISSDYPILATRSGSHFDVYWHRREGWKECVYAAFKCSSLWCVHSRSMYELVGRGGPSKNLDFVMSKILHRHEPAIPGEHNSIVAPMPHGKKAVFDVALHVRTRTLKIEKAIRIDSEKYNEAECEDPEDEGKDTNKFLRKCLWDCIGRILDTLRERLQATLPEGSRRGLTILLTTDDEDHRPEFVKFLERHGTVFFSQGSILHTSKASGTLMVRLPTMAEFFLMAKSHTLIEAGSYISTFAYFSGLVGNGTLAAIKMKNGGCRLALEHTAEIS